MQQPQHIRKTACHTMSQHPTLQSNILSSLSLAKAKALETKQGSVESHLQPQKDDPIHMSPILQGPKTLGLQRQPKSPPKSIHRRNKLDHCLIIKFPLTTESTMKKIKENNTLAFIEDAKANKHQIKQAVRQFCDTGGAKVNTPLRPEGEKPAYVQMAPHYDALDVASKIGII
ncbi:60S ribosomal protein L23a-like [Arvicola amphibius]|uniref:60S ribosomal protein L23a-like n=1 Tax=Arvicola amphibius TaxID=1047088 RepID=UPI001C0826ED|nr:60S ribosomal protein L23a-like [Arvicola amphibius]